MPDKTSLSLCLCPLPPASIADFLSMPCRERSSICFPYVSLPSGSLPGSLLLFSLITMTHSPFGSRTSVIHASAFYLCGKYRLMLLRQFPADTDAPSPSVSQLLSTCDQSVRCFVDHYCSCLIFQFIQDSRSLLLIRRKKCFKCESSRSKPDIVSAVTCAGSRTAVTVILASPRLTSSSGSEIPAYLHR